MQQLTLLTFFLLSFCIKIKSQVFNSNGGPIQNNGTETYFTLPVVGLSPVNIDSLHGLEEICITIIHPKVEELYIYLVSPSGTTIELTEGASCQGADYNGTCFNGNSSMPITSGIAPYSGTFRPIGNIGRFNRGQVGNGNWTLIVKDYLAFVNSGNLVSWNLKFSNTPPKPVILSASNLPIVIINTNNQSITDIKKVINLGIIYNGIGQINHPGDPMNNYNSKSTIRIGGNSTINFEKKNYNLELRDISGAIKINATILGMPAESDWCLKANYQDKTLMRIPLTNYLSRQMGNYAARTKNVEVIINGEYMGVYSLVEKVKVSTERVNIRKITTSDNAMPFISGGYLLKIDRSDVAGWYSLLPGSSQNNSHFYYQYDYPKDTAITAQQKAYIQSYCNDFETAVNATNYSDPLNGYQKYIDVASFVDFFIVNEISKNVDAYKLSTYLYKKDIALGGKLYIGPIWDYDIAWHNCNYANAFDPTGWQYQIQDTVHPSPVWWSKFMLDTAFVNKLYCRWQTLRQNILSNTKIYNYIDSTASAINEAQQRNFKQWPIIGTYVYPNPQNQTNATYATEVADLKTWISNRFAWLDGAIQGQCTYVGIKKYETDDNTVIVYPNPVENTATIKMHLTNNADVSLVVTNALGITIIARSLERINSGDSEIALNRSVMIGGSLYFYQLKINGVVHAGKIIVK